MFSGADLQAGEYSLYDDATQVFDESTHYDYFGQTITGGDIDGDGALDIDECDNGSGVDMDTDGDCDDDGVLASDDCDDDNADVFPGQIGYFSDSTNGSYDYDCDGTESSEYSIGVCDGGGIWAGGGCTLVVGWSESVPECGSTGQLITLCFEDFFGCSSETVEETSNCN